MDASESFAKPVCEFTSVWLDTILSEIPFLMAKPLNLMIEDDGSMIIIWFEATFPFT